MTCTTHHHACDCREAKHADEIARLKGEANLHETAVIISSVFVAFLGEKLGISLEQMDELREECSQMLATRRECKGPKDVN